MKISGKLNNVIIFTVFTAFFLSGCSDSNSGSAGSLAVLSSYRGIPGITDEEIAAIEKLKNETNEFIYGMISSTEAFMNADGELKGYSALLCEWLTELFGIKFTLKNFSWFGLLDGLESGEVDFTGDLTASAERRKTYFMSEAIAQRSIKYYRIAGSLPLQEIRKTRLPRFILQEKTTIAGDVLNYAGGTFEPVYILEYDEAYELLKTGQADALIAESAQEAYWDIYSDIAVSDFYPLIFSPVSFAARNPKLFPVVSVINKILESGYNRHFFSLNDLGYREYLKHKLSMRLTGEELLYIKNNREIPLAVEHDNYPISFFSDYNNEWQGICFDVLSQIEALTGLKFMVINDNQTEFHELMNMLESGGAHIISELISTPDREGRFLWPDNSFMTERSVLISRIEYSNININKIYSERVGLPKGTAHAEFFHRWFPNHHYALTYESQTDAFSALMNGEVDLVMNAYSSLQYLTNYLELAGFKINVIFNNSFESTFGINKDQSRLCSIIDKALELIDTGAISEQWRYKAYDYRQKIEQARMPWLIGSIVLSLLVLSLVAVLFIRSRMAGKVLERLVEKRTYELAFQTATLTTLFDSIPDLIFTKNLDLKFLHCNKAFLEHFNTNIDEVVGSTDSEAMGITVEEASTYNDMDRMVINEKQTVTIEEYIPHHNGTKPFYETIKMPLVLDNKVVGIMGIARDITKRKETESAALTASQLKSSFLAKMSHEIRTPMNAILGVTELMIMNEQLPRDIEEGLEKIYSSCDMLLGIINDILDFSKIEAGKLDIVNAQYKVASMINDSVHLNMMRIESKPIEFELQVDENIPASLIGDPLRIKQILNNLLSNAFKYTDSGKVVLSVSTEPIPLIAYLPDHFMNDHVKWHGHERKGTTLVLKVRDTGHGMTKEQLNIIFDEYSRFNRRKNLTVEGTGLGLAITERLVNLMDGSISVESEPNKGSLFTIKLPQEIVDSEVIGKELADNLCQFRLNFMSKRKRERIGRDLMPYGSVLIVDDVETNIYVAVGLMKLYRLQIDTAMNGHDAISKIKEGGTYDVIFMDHMMPEMDGIEAVKQIRGIGYTSPIIALTANAVAGQAEIFMQNGFDDFISKPIDIRQLNSILNKFVRDKQPQEVIDAANMQKPETQDAQSALTAQSSHADSLLIESFIRDAKKAVSLLDVMRFEKPVSEEILRRFTVIVHGIKSSLWNINETELANLAYKLETGGRELLSTDSDDDLLRADNTDMITLAVPEFLAQLRALLEKLEGQRGRERADKNPGAVDIEDLRVKLKTIQKMAADYNRKGVIDTISKAGSCSDEIKAAFDNIIELVLHSEFETAEKIASELEAGLNGRGDISDTLLNSKIPGLDLIKGLERYEGDEKTFLKVLRSYAASTRSILDTMEGLIIDQELNDYRIKVHGIKGSSADIFAGEIGSGAGDLEEAAKTGNIDFINRHNQGFMESARALLHEIDNLFLRLDTENPKPKKDKIDRGALLKLYNACKGYDMDGTDRAIAEIEKYNYESDGELADWLRESIDRMDLKQIAQKLEAVLQPRF